jgi:hypothetical protein
MDDLEQALLEAVERELSARRAGLAEAQATAMNDIRVLRQMIAECRNERGGGRVKSLAERA